MKQPSLIQKIKIIIVNYNDNKTRPTNLFMQRFSDNTFWTYAKLSPEDVISHSGFDVAMSHAFVNQVKQDDWGRWSVVGEVETHQTRLSEKLFRILCGGNYNIKFDQKRIMV